MKSGLRGSRYGWQTWQAGMQHLSNRTIGLDGVPAQQDNYRKSGFVLAGHNVRHAGNRGSIPETEMAGIVAVTPEILDRVIAYDRQFFPADRELHAPVVTWCRSRQPMERSVLSGDKVEGLGAIRQCRNGIRWGLSSLTIRI